MTNETVTNLPASQRHQGKPFVPERKDGWLALLTFVLGYLFIRWVLFSWQGWGVSLFTALYAGFVLAYLRVKERRMSSEGWFWFSVLVLTGLSYSFFEAHGLQPWRELFLFVSAVYWVISANELPLLGRTSEWLPLDFLQGLIVIPFSNFGLQYRSLATLRNKRASNSKELWPVALGLLLSLIVTAIVLPLLIEADSGGFMAIAQSFMERMQWIKLSTMEFFVYLLLTIPTSAFLYGLVAGSAHRRANPAYKLDTVSNWANSLRILPVATVLTMLGTICCLYLVFIGSQVPYFFSAFTGTAPQGWLVYSTYARNGFFELCSIAIINLSLLVGANLAIKKQEGKHIALKALNSLLALLTLLLIATAFSKMALYISAYGLSVKRVLPCVLMVFMAFVFIGFVVMQKYEFSLMRLSALVGAVIMCVLCLANLDGFVANYNANRYLNGTLSNFDVQILFRAGPAGVNAALQVYSRTEDETLKDALNEYLYKQRDMAHVSSGKMRDTVQNSAVRRSLAKHIFSPKPIPGYDLP